MIIINIMEPSSSGPFLKNFADLCIYQDHRNVNMFCLKGSKAETRLIMLGYRTNEVLTSETITCFETAHTPEEVKEMISRFRLATTS